MSSKAFFWGYQSEFFCCGKQGVIVSSPELGQTLQASNGISICLTFLSLIANWLPFFLLFTASRTLLLD